MNTIEQIEIPLSKKKLTLMLAGSIAFVVTGFWFIIKRPVSSLPFLGSPIVVLITGLAAVSSFGVCAIFIIKKLTENTPGLIINDQGITDNSSGVAAGLILWKDILDIRRTTVFNQSFIVVILKNPEAYIARQPNPVKRQLMKMNYKTYDSPVNISSNGLICNFDELYNLLKKDFASAR